MHERTREWQSERRPIKFVNIDLTRENISNILKNVYWEEFLHEINLHFRNKDE